MAVPDFQALMLPLLKLAGDGQKHTFAEAVERLAEEFQLSDDDRGQLLKSGQTRMYNRVGWTSTYLKKAGLLQAVGLGRFQLTDRGRDVLTTEDWRRRQDREGSNRCTQLKALGPRAERKVREMPSGSAYPVLSTLSELRRIKPVAAW